jgi:hypothetical protein
VDQHKLARQAIERLVELDMEDNLARWCENIDDLPEPPSENVGEPENKKPSKHARWIFGLALLLIIVAGAVWVLQTSHPRK